MTPTPTATRKWTRPEDYVACRSQGYYIAFCYEDVNDRFVAPVGGLDGMVIADLAADGTTPPVGTVIRFTTPEGMVVIDVDDAPTAPPGFTLGEAFPNPFSATTTVPYEVERSGPVRLSVYDVLGRRVADARRWRGHGGRAPGDARRRGAGGGDVRRRAGGGGATGSEEGAGHALTDAYSRRLRSPHGIGLGYREVDCFLIGWPLS